MLSTCQHVDTLPISGYRRCAEHLAEFVDRDDLSHHHSNLRATTRGLQTVRRPAEIPSSCWSKTGGRVTPYDIGRDRQGTDSRKLISGLHWIYCR